jgi:hypothetical protein
MLASSLFLARKKLEFLTLKREFCRRCNATEFLTKSLYVDIDDLFVFIVMKSGPVDVVMYSDDYFDFYRSLQSLIKNETNVTLTRILLFYCLIKKGLLILLFTM